MRKFFIFVSILWVLSCAFAAEVAVTTSIEGEIVQQLPFKLSIQITSKGNVEIQNIDLQLSDDVHRVGFTSSSVNQQYINGQSIAVQQQIIGLKTYKPGQFYIPPVQVTYRDRDTRQTAVAVSDTLFFEAKVRNSKGFAPGAEGAPKWLNGLILLLIFAGVYWQIQRKKKQSRSTQQQTVSPIDQYRAQLIRISVEDERFWEEISHWIQASMKAKLTDISGNPTLLELLVPLQNELSVADFEAVKPIFEMCHQARFAPIETTVEQREQVKNQMIEHFLKIFS